MEIGPIFILQLSSVHHFFTIFFPIFMKLYTDVLEPRYLRRFHIAVFYVQSQGQLEWSSDNSGIVHLEVGSQGQGHQLL